MDTHSKALSAYIPIDRQHAMASSQPLPAQANGAALFADISGFTPLAEALIREMGAQRGPEELTNYLNLVYDALIAEVHRFHGSVIFFSGDAITCWFEDELDPATNHPPPATLRATACALAIQTAMQQFAALPTPSGGTVALSVKVATVPALRLADEPAGVLHRERSQPGGKPAQSIRTATRGASE